MKTALRALEWLENTLVVLFAAGLVLLAGIQVFARLVLDTGFGWIEQAESLLLIWLTVAGAVVAARQHQHLGIDVLSERLKPGLRTAFRVLTVVFAAAVCVVLAQASWELMQLERETPSEATQLVPAWVKLTALPIGFGLMALHYLVQIAKPVAPPHVAETPPAAAGSGTP